MTITEVDHIMNHAYSHLGKQLASCNSRDEQKGIDKDSCRIVLSC